MARNIPQVCDSSLEQDTDADHFPTIGTAEWYVWLEDQRAFHFEATCGTFTARKEQRHAGWYWYAYRRCHGTLHTAYLGKSQELTLERLNEVARALASATAPAQDVITQILQEEHARKGVVSGSLLYTKLSIPPTPPTIVARPRLTQRLNEGMSHKLTLISAPAGFGKTALVSEWLQQSGYPHGLRNEMYIRLKWLWTCF